MSRRQQRWEGSRVYDRAWAGVFDLILPEHSDDEVSEAFNRGEITQSIPFYRWLLAGMNDAHVVEIGADQLGVLPDMDEKESVEYALNARLPFDPLFIGYSELDRLGEQVIAEADKRQAELAKTSPAMAMADELINPGPFGDGFTAGALLTQQNPLDYLPKIKQIRWELGKSERIEEDVQPNVAMSIIPFFNITTDFARTDLGYHSMIDGRILHAPGAYCLDADTGEWAYLLPNVTLDDDDVDADQQVENMIRKGVKIACEAAYFLESYNVELVEQEVTRQVRRNAERHDKKISMVVHVRLPKQRKKPVARNGEEREFSHRFEVRGHYKHFPQGTRMADSIPEEKLTHVPGRGLCRKVWCPPFVKGPTDKPLIPKIRIVHDEEGEQ